MREIKFRLVWERPSKWYGPYSSGDAKCHFTFVDFNNLRPSIDEMTQSGLETFDDKYVLLKAKEQFTGLKDKNGKDIYEGDIVRFPAIDIGLKGKWAVAIIEDDSGCSYSLMGVTPLDFEGSEESLSDVSIGCELKIIGNIHENPELLEGGSKK